jgi:hypothetical protein
MQGSIYNPHSVFKPSLENVNFAVLEFKRHAIIVDGNVLQKFALEEVSTVQVSNFP